MFSLYSHEPFIGRTKEIDTIHNAFLNGKRAVFVTGYAGVGKTRLVEEYANKYKHEYHNIKNIYPLYMFSSGKDYLRQMEFASLGDTNCKTLLIVDGLDSVREGEDLFLQLLPIFLKNSNLNLIFTTRNGIQIPPHITHRIQPLFLTLDLYNLSDRDAFALVNNLLTSLNKTNCNAYLYNRIRDISNGNPLLLTSFVHAIVAGKVDVFQPTDMNLIHQGLIFNNYGNSIINGITPTIEKIRSHTIFVVKNSMEEIAKAPDKMYDLTPRQFEEVIAELYQKCGYTVELTKQTRDGGKDIYLAHKNDLGSFLYLVQCKKYSKEHSVGVSVLREVYGVQTSELQKPSGSIIATTSHFTKDARNFIVERQLEYQMYLHDFDFISRLLREKYIGK